MENFINLLKNIDMFKCFTEDDLSEIFEQNFKIKKYLKNSIIHIQNETCKSMDIILEGSIIIQKIDAEGKVLSINDFSTGDIFGENLLFSTENKYPMTISAKSDVKILHVDKNIVLKLCQSNESFLINFLQLLSSKALFLTSKITSTMKTLRQCIIEFLLFEYYAQQTNKIKLNMTKKELADKIGVQRTSLSRELNKMREENLIDYDAKYIIINDVELLNEMHIES